jgi:N-carbamoylputrescine amidase
MQGHSAANLVPLVTSNRAGVEVLTDSGKKEKQRILFYGTSFITDNTGCIMQECCDARKVAYGDDGGAKDIEIISFTVDIHEYRAMRASWGVFRDRRPELYKLLLTLDGRL